MENVNQTAIYSQLHENLCKNRSIPDIDWHKFMEKTTIAQFRKDEVILEPGETSTHSYFIISGLIMCHEPLELKKHIYWFRAENDFAFSSSSLNIGKQPRENKEQLIALEDTVVVSISNADLAQLIKDNHQIFIMYGEAFAKATIVFKELTIRSVRDPQYAYDHVQANIGFNLDRVPDDYLARYLFTTVKKLKAIREAVEK